MALFDQWPYVNIHNLNTDWLVKTVKAVKDLAEAIKEKTDDIDDSVARARDSAANAKISEDNAKGSEDAAKDYYDMTSVLVGKPLSANLLSDMTDTTTIYVYTGSEPGMDQGDWYYYDGNDWVSGGKWGSDGGVNTNARNLLQYILERVAYTETGMQVYVDALYEALAQFGSVTTTYTITNALSHVTNSNTATGCEVGDSYTATLTPDAGYTISVIITMGGVDVTSTVYNNGTITIPSVNGDVVITAIGTVPVEMTQSAQGIGSGANLYRDEGVTTFDSLKTSGAIYYYLSDVVVSDTTYEVSITITTGINTHEYKSVYAYSADLLSGAGTASPTMYNVITLAQNGIINAQTDPISVPFTFTTNVTISANSQLAIVFYRNHANVISSITARRTL